MSEYDREQWENVESLKAYYRNFSVNWNDVNEHRVNCAHQEEDHIEHFQTVLRNAEKDPELVIHEAEETAGSKVGDNYMSVVLHTNVKGIRGNGTPYSGSFMTKYLPRHRSLFESFRNGELFLNEAHVYNKILPLLGNIGPRCVSADGNEIIMDDLRIHGYTIQPRLDLLDLEHCSAVIVKLATLHARSLSLKLKDPEHFKVLTSPLVESVFPSDDKPCLGTSIENALKTAIKHLNMLDESENLIAAKDFLKSFETKAFNIMKNLVQPGRNEYDVITHGDSWMNNFLFKHDENGRVADVKLIDFQIVRHVSPSIDFHYFVYSSANPTVIGKNYDDLVEIYHKTFRDELCRLKVDEKHLRELTIDRFRAELRKFALYGLFTSFWLVNAILAEEDDVIDLDKLTVEQLGSMSEYESPLRAKKAERISCIVQDFIARYQ